MNFLKTSAVILIAVFLLLPSLSGYTMDGLILPTGPKKSDTAKKEKTWNLVFAPYIFYQPETKLAVGLGGFLNFSLDNDDPKANSSFIEVTTYFTQNKQAEAYVIGTLWFKDNLYKSKFDVTYRIFPEFFYGIGNESPESAEEEYNQRSILVKLDVLKKISRKKLVYSGFQYEFQRYNVIEIAKEGILETEGITGVNGGTISGFGYLFNLDNRNHVFYPNKGNFLDISLTFYDKIFGSSFQYLSLIMDYRQFVSLKKERVLAFQIYTQFNMFDPPFQKMGVIGHASRLRGIYNGRFRDRNAFSAQVEYRSPLFWRFGYTAFFGAGRVSEHVHEMLFVDEYKVTAGFGLRFMFNKKDKVNLRMDAAIGPKEDWKFYFSLREAF